MDTTRLQGGTVPEGITPLPLKTTTAHFVVCMCGLKMTADVLTSELKSADRPVS